MVEPFLEGKSLSEAIKRKKIYLMDLTYMAAIKCINNNKVQSSLLISVSGRFAAVYVTFGA